MTGFTAPKTHQGDRARKTLAPCPRCRMHITYCFCESIPSLALKTKVSVLVHAKELKRTTNTGSLATLALANSGLHVRGLKDQPLEVSQILNPSYEPLLFFPADDAAELTPDFVSKLTLPVQLIVPDGNWRQASKVHTRHEELANIPRVRISARNTATQFLRKETTPEGMATLQAIAEALGILEGPEAREILMTLYNLKLQRTLKARGVPVLDI